MSVLIKLDGWNISVDWEKLYYGDSFFVPSINTEFDRTAIRTSAEQAGCAIAEVVVVEDDVQGVRVWVLRGVL